MAHPGKEDKKFKRKLFNVLEDEGCEIIVTANSHYKVRLPNGETTGLTSTWLSKPYEKRIRKAFEKKNFTFGEI